MVRLMYTLFSGDIRDSKIDTLVYPVYSRDGKPLVDPNVDRVFNGLLTKVIVDEGFKADVGETISVYAGGDVSKIIMIGLGEKPGLDDFRTAIGVAVNQLLQRKSVRAGIYLVDLENSFDPRILLFETIITSEIALYDPSENYRKERKEMVLKEIVLLTKNMDQGIIEVAEKISDAINYARRIADAPSSVMNPEGIEREATKLAEQYGLGLKVYRRDDLVRMGLNGILAVGSGGGVEPRLIILEYRGRSGNGWDYGLVGKTVTFDAGGLNLKQATAMIDMKYDKSGGAAVLGIVKAIAELKLPINMVAALPCVENLPGPGAYKPRDIIKMYNGLNVEIGNTDAEGRLILADAISYVEKNYSPNLIIDLATLTGAIVVALGNYAAGVFTGNDDVARELFEIGLKVGERVWRMPLWKEYYEQLKSDIADMNNVGGSAAGAITAAAFLSKFVSDTSRWVHIDIAGTAWVQSGHPKKPYYKQASTGYGVKLLTSYMLHKQGLFKLIE